MSASKTKRKITYLLTAGTLLLWGIVIFRVISFLSHDSGSAGGEYPARGNNEYIQSEGRVRWDTLSVSSMSLNRDPFQYRQPVVVKMQIEAKTEKISMPKPSDLRVFIISGVIISEHDRLVILKEKDDGREMFLRQNQEYGNMRIIDIQRDTITIIENGNQRKIGF
jgi:hypothetical protein